MGVFEFDSCRNRKLGQRQSVIAKRVSFGRYTCPRVLKDALAVCRNKSGLGEYPRIALGEAFLKCFFVVIVEKMERTAAWVFTVVRERYRKVMAGFREHLERPQVPILLKLFNDHGSKIHALPVGADIALSGFVLSYDSRVVSLVMLGPAGRSKRRL